MVSSVEVSSTEIRSPDLRPELAIETVTLKGSPMKATSQQQHPVIAVAVSKHSAMIRQFWRTARYAGCACLLLMFATSLSAQLFQQDFSASSTVADYVSPGSPNSGQWNAIGASGVGTTVG